MKCLVLSWRPESYQVSLKIIYFGYKPLELCITSTFVYLQPLFVTHVLIVEGLVLI